MIQKFLDYIAIEKRYSARTVGEYGDDLKAWCQFLGWEVEEFDPKEVRAEDVKLWMIDMLDRKQSPRSVKRRLSAVKSFYKFLLRVGLVKVDITRAIVAPKTDKPLPIYFRESEMQGVKINQERDWNEEMSEEEQWVHMRDYLMVELLYQTGMRRAELVGLKEEDVDTRQKQIRVFGKRAKERIVPIGEGLCELIEEYRENKCKLLGEQVGIGNYGEYIYERIAYDDIAYGRYWRDSRFGRRKSEHCFAFRCRNHYQYFCPSRRSQTDGWRERLWRHARRRYLS